MKTSSARWPAIALALLCLAAAAGCRSTYYAAYEKFGVHKRDLLKKRVTAARDGQQAAQEQFRDALTRLKEITAFSGGELERAHRARPNTAASSAQTVRQRIRDVKPWRAIRSRNGKRKSADPRVLQAASRQQLDATRRRYEECTIWRTPSKAWRRLPSSTITCSSSSTTSRQASRRSKPKPPASDKSPPLEHEPRSRADEFRHELAARRGCAASARAAHKSRALIAGKIVSNLVLHRLAVSDNLRFNRRRSCVNDKQNRQR